MRRSVRNRRAGVTLLETMIALAVMAMISVLLASGLGMVARVLNRSTDVTADVDQALNRLQLRGWIEHTASTPFPGFELTGFSGGETSFTFEALPGEGLFWPGSPVVVTVNADEGGKITVHAAGAADSTSPLTQDLALSRPGTGLRVSYYGRKGPDVPPDWQTNWPADLGPPQLVMLTAATDNPGFPPLTVRPGKALRQREMSLSSLVPPALPSRP